MTYMRMNPTKEPREAQIFVAQLYACGGNMVEGNKDEVEKAVGPEAYRS